MKNQENQENKNQKLFKYINSKKFGDIIKHEEIENILGITREFQKYSGYMKNMRRQLIVESKILKSIPNVGYQILTPEQVSGYTYRQYIKRTLNMYNTSKDILDNLIIDDLNEDRMKEYNDVKELNNKLKEISSKTIKESHYFSRKEYYNSLN